MKTAIDRRILDFVAILIDRRTPILLLSVVFTTQWRRRARSTILQLFFLFVLQSELVFNYCILVSNTHLIILLLVVL
jgi:hypothetical protein